MTTERPHSRARNVALIGLVFEVLLAAFFAIMMVWTQSEALRGLTLLTGCGIPIWLYMVLVYHQRVLVQEEEMETEELRRERERGTLGEAIFDQENLLLAQRRLAWMYKWLLPIFTILIVLGLAIGGLSNPTPVPLGPAEVTAGNINPAAATLAIWFLGGAAFLTFLLSRFASGLGRYAEWRILRSGSSWLMGIAIGTVATVAALAPLHYYPDMVRPERVIAYAIRILLLVLAAETLFNFVLDFYRPRSPGEEPRPAFDSRLLGLFSEPGGIARSIADAVNYQFGFEVSSTWLYKLLERAALPLVGFAVLVLFAASSLVIVQADEQAVVERFGIPKAHALDPGLHLKMPWPIDVAYKVSTQRIHEMKLGNTQPGKLGQVKSELILWTNDHEEEPHVRVLIATPKLAEFMSSGPSSQPAGAGTTASAASTRPAADIGTNPELAAGATFGEAGNAVSVSMLRVALTIQYEIKDAKDWISRYKDPENMLEAIACHELTQACASQTIEAMLGPGRVALEEKLRQRVGRAVENASLGIRIRLLALQGVHPPSETAQAFQDVIGAEQKRTASISSAWADYNTRLSKVAGDRSRAEALSEAVQRMNRLDSDTKASPQDRTEVRDLVHTLFFGDAKQDVSPIGGEAAGIMAKARAKRWTLENQAHGQAELFVADRINKDAAPQVFYLRQKLAALAHGMQGIRKFVLAAHGKMNIGTLHLNLQDPANAQLDFSTGENN